jgi:hypothetical protein
MLINHGLENVVVVDVPTHKCGKQMGANNEGKSDISQKCHKCNGKPWTISYINGLTCFAPKRNWNT